MIISNTSAYNVNTAVGLVLAKKSTSQNVGKGSWEQTTTYLQTWCRGNKGVSDLSVADRRTLANGIGIVSLHLACGLVSVSVSSYSAQAGIGIGIVVSSRNTES